MKKRWLAASLAALMALSMTACGGGKAAETTAAPVSYTHLAVFTKIS